MEAGSPVFDVHHDDFLWPLHLGQGHLVWTLGLGGEVGEAGVNWFSLWDCFVVLGLVFVLSTEGGLLRFIQSVLLKVEQL